MPTRRFFSLEQANALVPAVAERLVRIMQLNVLLRRDVEAPGLCGVPWLADPVLAVWSDDELEKHHLVASAVEGALADEVDFLEDIGVSIQDLATGLVTFPSFLDGVTEVTLCWQLGEPAIRSYRRLSPGARGMLPVRDRRFVAEQKPSGRLAG